VSEARRCWAEISAAALRHNLGVIHECVEGKSGVMAIVKANAYGHGLAAVLDAVGGEVEMLGVANLEEALSAREISPDASIFILGSALPEERAEIAARGFIPSISSVAEAREFARFAAEGRPLKVHLVLDTGMGRIGVWQDDALLVAGEIGRIHGLRIAGLATHLPVADEDETFTAEQLARFERLLSELVAAGIRAPVVHSLNSAGVIRFSRHAGSLVRAGLMLYGSSPIPDFQPRLRPALTWKTRITLIRDVASGRGVSYGRTFITPRAMRIATLAVGYADGYQRQLSNRGTHVLIGGRRCAVLGRVTMDQILADVSQVPEAAPGGEAVLIGRQGDQEILAGELAEKAGTIPWEIFTGIGPRVERVAV
jgi:alanine racemase